MSWYWILLIAVGSFWLGILVMIVMIFKEAKDDPKKVKRIFKL